MSVRQVHRPPRRRTVQIRRNVILRRRDLHWFVIRRAGPLRRRPVRGRRSIRGSAVQSRCRVGRGGVQGPGRLYRRRVRGRVPRERRRCLIDGIPFGDPRAGLAASSADQSPIARRPPGRSTLAISAGRPARRTRGTSSPTPPRRGGRSRSAGQRLSVAPAHRSALFPVSPALSLRVCRR